MTCQQGLLEMKVNKKIDKYLPHEYVICCLWSKYQFANFHIRQIPGFKVNCGEIISYTYIQALLELTTFSKHSSPVPVIISISFTYNTYDHVVHP